MKTWFLILAFASLAHAQDLWPQILSRAKETESSSLVVIRDGKIVYSDFFGGKDQPADIESATKSIAALAIARLIDEKKIASFDAPMSTWLPSWAKDPVKSKITLRMILNHTSGLPDVIDHATSTVKNAPTTANFFYQDDLVKAAEQTALVGEPGKQFLYSSIGASTLQAVISQASGESVASYVGRIIFAPLGITDFKWSKDKVGHELTSGGLYLSTADLEKIGALVLGGGSFGGKQIISPAAFSALVTKSQPFADYGLNWWLSGDGKTISAKGYGGQFVVVTPSKNLIAVRTKNIWKLAPDKLENGKFKDFPDLISKWQP